MKGFVIQTGDPLTRHAQGDQSRWGTGGSDKNVPLEVGDSDLRNDVGAIGMARSQHPDSGSSQFYINLSDNSTLNGHYAVFGKVLSGLDVAQALSGVPVDADDVPRDPGKALLNKVTIWSTLPPA